MWVGNESCKDEVINVYNVGMTVCCFDRSKTAKLP